MKLINIFRIIIILANVAFANAVSEIASNSADNYRINEQYIKTLRYFQQIITKEALIILSDCDSKISSPFLGFNSQLADQRIRNISASFEKIIDGFLNGNPEMGIVLTPDAYTRNCIRSIDSSWKIYKLNIEETTKDRSVKNIGKIMINDADLFDKINQCSKNVKSKFKLQKLMTISQILAKNFYLIYLNQDSEKNKEISKQLIKDFDEIRKNLNSFKNDPDIVKFIAELNDLWIDLKSCFEMSIYADKISQEKLSEVVKLSTEILDKIGNLYIKLE